MNPTLISDSSRAGRSYSVGATLLPSAYQENSQHQYGRREPSKMARPHFDTVHELEADASPRNPFRANASYAEADAVLQRELLERYDLTLDDVAAFDSEPKVLTTKQTGSKVVARRIHRSSLQAAGEVDREIEVLSTVTDPSIPLLIESLELKDVIWTIKEHRPLQTLSQLIKDHGPLPEDVLKTSLNQLFSGIAALFYAGYAHLRICDKTICFDNDRQLVITDFHCCTKYGDDKVDDLYAATQEKCGDDIYVAPEVFACTTYNARKATIWSCGVLLYFMVTGQTAKLSNLDHPSFESTSTPNPAPSRNPQTHRRMSSAAGVNTPIIHYPNASRFSIPNYVRWVVPKMLTSDPLRRAELIEIATRIPKDFAGENTTRSLIEVAWLDYKHHVGPYAGLQFDEPDSSASSIYSLASNLSNPFRSLLGRGSRRQSAPVGGGAW